MLNFDWDSSKAKANLRKHGLSFEEASTAFEDTLSMTISDPLSSVSEERFVTIGETELGKLVVVVHTDRRDTVHIISARKASRRERMLYEEK